MTEASPQQKSENPFVSLAFNIALPVLILNKGTAHLGAINALILALAFPTVYGSYDLYRRRKVNFISLLGLLNVGITGGFAVSGLTGIWFAVKETAFPLLIGVFVAASSWTRRPFLQTMIVNPQTMHWDLVDEKLKALGREEDFFQLLRVATRFLSISFLFSAIANFVIAMRVFTPIDAALSSEAQAATLNDQIAQMTTVTFAVTFVPSLLILGGILFYLFRGITRTTGLTLEQIMK